jgi:hypothetical protein
MLREGEASTRFCFQEKKNVDHRDEPTAVRLRLVHSERHAREGGHPRVSVVFMSSKEKRRGWSAFADHDEKRKQLEFIRTAMTERSTKTATKRIA